MMAGRRGGGEMPSLEERVAYLEGRFEDHTAALGDLQRGVSQLREDGAPVPVHSVRQPSQTRYQ